MQSMSVALYAEYSCLNQADYSFWFVSINVTNQSSSVMWDSRVHVCSYYYSVFGCFHRARRPPGPRRNPRSRRSFTDMLRTKNQSRVSMSICRSSRFDWDMIFVHTNMLPVGFKPRDDELDPMDPAAYSDTPRYSLTLNRGRMPPECCKPKFTTFYGGWLWICW